MPLWASYFAVKAYWDWRGSIRMTFLWNAALFAAIMLPEPKEKAARWAWRAGLSLAAFLIFWRDSYLPSLSTSLKFAGAPGRADLGFTVRFLAGALSPGPILVSGLLMACCYWAWKKGLRLGPLCLIVLTGVFIRGLREPKGEHERGLLHFYETERHRVVKLPPLGRQPFDVVFLHVCSLSWDDLDAIGALDHPLLRPYDHIFTDFNSASSYSTPAALRLSRALCGQAPNDELYQRWPEGCDLWSALRASGFKTYAAMNHQGLSRDMLKQLQDLAGLDPVVELAGLPVKALNFDSAPLFSDDQVLGRWLELRAASTAPAVLYYNTISLHGGVHGAGADGWETFDRTKAYRAALDRFASDLERFYARLAASRRRAVVFFVPEHGMAYRGSPMQANELRDLPLPPITRVPVGVKFFGPQPSGRAQARHDEPISYLALAQLLASFLDKPPFDPVATDLPPLPLTDFVSENAGATVLRDDGRYFLRAKDDAWRILP